MIKKNHTDELFAAKVAKFGLDSIKQQQVLFKELGVYSKVDHKSILSLKGINLQNFEKEYFPTLITEYDKWFS